jgi:hypothetical protein
MARIDLGWENGRRRRKTIYGPTRKSVAAQLLKLLQSAQAGTVITDERQTVASYLASWLDYKRPRLRARAFATYQQAVERHLVRSNSSDGSPSIRRPARARARSGTRGPSFARL